MQLLHFLNAYKVQEIKNPNAYKVQLLHFSNAHKMQEMERSNAYKVQKTEVTENKQKQ